MLGTGTGRRLAAKIGCRKYLNDRTRSPRHASRELFPFRHGFKVADLTCEPGGNDSGSLHYRPSLHSSDDSATLGGNSTFTGKSTMKLLSATSIIVICQLFAHATILTSANNLTLSALSSKCALISGYIPTFSLPISSKPVTNHPHQITTSQRPPYPHSRHQNHTRIQSLQSPPLPNRNRPLHHRSPRRNCRHHHQKETRHNPSPQ